MSLLLLLRPHGAGPAGPANFAATGALAAQAATLSGTATLSRTATGALAASSATMDGSATSSATPAAVAPQRGVGGRRYRVIEDPDQLCEELVKEEKLVTKDRKKLKILQKKSPASQVGLYRVEQQIQAVEARLDDRLARIAELMSLIQIGLDAIDDDDEEVMFL